MKTHPESSTLITHDDSGVLGTWTLSCPREGRSEDRTITAVWPPGFGRTSTNHGIVEGEKGPFHTVPDDYETAWKEPKSDGDSFKQIRHSGRMKMSPYSTGTFKRRFFIEEYTEKEVTIEGKGNDRYRSYSPGDTTSYCSTPPWDEQPYPFGTPFVTYRQLRHVSVANAKGPHYDAYVPFEKDVASAIEDIKSQVSTRIAKRWDVMTDIFETRATANQAKSILRSAISPIETYRKARRTLLSAKASEKELRQLWLSFRYGIMPVMYSAHDLAKLLAESGSKYLTERASTSVSIESNLSTVPQEECTFTVASGDILIRGTGKMRFTNSNLRMFHGTSLNVINSTWELIPYSLIVDWFTNFGDYLYNQTRLMRPNGDEIMSYSVRRKVVYHKYARVKQPDGSFLDFLIQEDKEDSYDRRLFTARDVSFHINVRFSNWKRWVDAYAMGITPITKALRRLL